MRAALTDQKNKWPNRGYDLHDHNRKTISVMAKWSNWFELFIEPFRNPPRSRFEIFLRWRKTRTFTSRQFNNSNEERSPSSVNWFGFFLLFFFEICTRCMLSLSVRFCRVRFIRHPETHIPPKRACVHSLSLSVISLESPATPRTVASSLQHSLFFNSFFSTIHGVNHA